MERKGNWIQIYTGRQYWPLDPRVGDFNPIDIAHSLAMQCRYGGHCLKFYSVAEHSVLLSQYVSPRAKLYALLHDAAETYLKDMVRPLKVHIPEYGALEERTMTLLLEQFRVNVTDAIRDEVYEADTRILTDERLQNMNPCDAEWSTQGDALGIQLRYWTPEEAKMQFLEHWLTYSNSVV